MGLNKDFHKKLLIMQTFIDRQTILNNKLERVKAIKAGFNAKGWANLSKKVTFDLNNVYDLQYKIEAELHQNWCEFKDWHYENFKFNTY
jgi:hypothetical protein